MDEKRLREMLEKIRNGGITPDDALDRLKHLPFEDLGFARIDTHRAVRTGVGEVIYSAGKTVAQIQKIVTKIMEDHENIMATRADPEVEAATGFLRKLSGSSSVPIWIQRLNW